MDGVYVNGHGALPGSLLDTGTVLNHLDPKLAKSIGLKASLRVEVISAFAVAQAPAAEGIEIALESAKAGGQRIVFSGPGDRSPPPGVRHKGNPGAGSFCRRFDYLLDFRAKRLEFSKLDRTGTRAELQTIHGQPALSTKPGPVAARFGHGLGGSVRRPGAANGMTSLRWRALQRRRAPCPASR